MSTIIYQVSTYVTPVDVEVEDGGDAKIVGVLDDKDDGMYVQVRSWEDHELFDQMIGRTIRVTVEILEEGD